MPPVFLAREIFMARSRVDKSVWLRSFFVFFFLSFFTQEPPVHMWCFWRGWQQCTTMDKTWSRKQPTRHQPRHPPLCPGRSCRCGLAHLQVCWDPPVMGTSLDQTRVRKVGGISVFEGLYQHHVLQTVVLIASYSISDGVCFVLCWKYILSWRTHIMYNLPDVYEQQMSPSYHWSSHNWEKSILSPFSKLQKLYAKT